MRRLVLVGLMCASALALSSASAAAATPSLKKQFAPLNLRIKGICNDIGTSLQSAGTQTGLNPAKEFAGLAQRTAGATIAVTKLKGASGTKLTLQRTLALALARGATDLAAIATAAEAHNVAKARAARTALIKDSASIKSSRAALAKALGVRA
jgi:hypothetical protein